ncbi:Alb1-domain-containing protein [Xylaria flabelliformis]|nr:Alb1-domain-containing protein [Xylaria flabelliformis]
MAKGTIAKKKKAPSLHSRAARRATSPGIDTDKSLKNVQPPANDSVDHRPSILAIHHGAGVSKKQKKGRAMSSRARKRQEKAQDRAAAVMERTEKKAALSKDSSRTIQTRRKVWDEINQDISSKSSNKTRTAPPKPTASHDEDDGTEESELDEEMGEAGGEHGRRQQGDIEHVDATETRIDQDDQDGIS